MSDAECAICLERSARPARGACVHEFCFDCIVAWAQTTNSCPLCKVEFRFIETKDGKKKVRIAQRVQEAEYDDSEIERLNLSSASASFSEDVSEYDLDGFVVGDDASVDRSSVASDSEDSASESSIEVIQPKRRRLRRRVADETE
jgi:uncharacterized Zn finger protein (UPF0148 family)